MKTGSMMIIIGCISIVMGLPSFLLYGELSPDIFLILGGILLIIIGVFRNKGYFNKNYYMAIFSVIALWGLTLLYIFLFRTNEYLGDTDFFYILVGLFILLMISFGGAYIRRRKKLDL
ncbi:LPXTG cell wall anchor domain-containing protein [Methanobacterium congolense]|uniref:Putative membrane protein n=1 Tax=Methanobacterium congolense TaxID=118062 RepID=A0A1D3L5P5_9EURY|nr:LPXTG cell wall anchor domain-containing protein [Methanobacterium congolense]SCG86855.1 putative membrane protein [Methanobacterium congolense]